MSTSARRLGKYELREPLGHGGMAEVWKAFDMHLQRYVAIKLLHADLQNDPDFMNRFEREARVVAGLHHRNIVQVHDFQISRPPESENTIAYMVMEYIEGQTLTSYIQSTSSSGRFPSVTDIIHLFASVSSAIDYAHQRGMLHRDIKPANILLDQHNQSLYEMGEPILTDFGIVKLLGSSTGTLTGGWLGTPVYISPEQAQGQPCDERSDIYSLGVILYEVCTGVRPFQGSNPISIIMQHINVMPTSPELINPKIPSALSQVILQSLAKDPSARFPSASALTVALATAFNMPIPTKLNQVAYSLDTTSDPTYVHPPQPDSPTPITPPLPITSLNGITDLPYTVIPSMPQFAGPVSNGLHTPTTPTASPRTSFLDKRTESLPMKNRGSSAYSMAEANTPIPLPGKPSHPSTDIGNTRNMWSNRLVIVVAVMLLLVSSSAGAFFWLSRTRPATPPPPITANVLVGNTTFVSSELLGTNSAQGLNDQLRIDLSNIPAPAPSKSYYAWLLSDKTCDINSINKNLQCDPNDPKRERMLHPIAPILLGRLPFSNGNIHFFYAGDQQHTNLVGTMSRFLITEENTSTTPTTPSPQRAAQRYYAELPQTPADVEQHAKAIDTLRQMLYEDIPLVALGLHGGSDIHLYTNTQKVFEWADSARDAQISKNMVMLRQQIVRILTYLDGATNVKMDVPPNTPLQVDTTLASIPLLGLHNSQFKGYISRIDANLNGLVSEYGVTPKMGQLATQIDTALTGNIQNWLEQVRLDAKQLIGLTDAQLEAPSAVSLIDNLVTQATYAYNGQVDPSTGKLQEGVAQIHADIQQLITFDVRSYT